MGALDWMYDNDSDILKYNLRIFLERTKEIKVVYDKNMGAIKNVVVMLNGTEIEIEL